MDESPPPEVRLQRRIIRQGDDAPPMPPVAALLKNIGQAGARALERVKQKQSVLRPTEEQVRLLAVCESNVCGRWEAGRQRCAECGCFGRLKVRLAAEKCPLGHWG